MKRFIFAILGLLMTSLSWALAPSTLSFVACEKTYVNPEEVLLEHATIHVQTENVAGVTSAIYSDGRGLYYQDIQLDETLSYDDLFDEAFFANYSDEPSVLFKDESLITKGEPTKKKLSRRSTSWPYCDKRR
ncbi:hypothetical protein [Simkania negevensis]|uniref:Uncharacterized protein n=1 Tax=Simkania negevensis (strain ATCC VR-1471 / DSM 27360 / Z) TaxID=331113 RepID=F8L622_SIMNZ|nr:hypothetical protein [Simkania negevensis]CCB88176.1 unknown protein [Simkania negevensis Z]